MPRHFMPLDRAATGIGCLTLSGRIRLARNVTSMDDMINAYTIFVGNQEERRMLEIPWINGRIMLNWILQKLVRRMWTGIIWLKIGLSGVLL
jgi:hypothetical protein